MRSLVLVFAITLFSQPMAVAQKQAQDALSKSLDSISDAIESIQPDSIILPTLEKFRNKASSNQLNYEYANSYLLEFDHYFYNGQWEAAIKAAETALILGKDLPDLKQKTEVQVNALNCIGYVYSYEGDFSEALNMRLKALEIADNGVCTRKDMGNLLSWIADDYRHLYQ
ncbi:MAG: tetratricopeptide repeat protein, partial [Mangrovimonas sp.]|nr:tetratricopeptide repeat protein [Mangrovimonas sp.]